MSQRLFLSGGKGGLALIIAQFFIDQGWLVDAPSHNELDVSDAQAIKQWFSARPAYHCAVCTAGITADKVFLRLSPEDWSRVTSVNLKGAAWCACEVAKKMKMQQIAGSIMLIGSYAGIHPKAGQCAYATSKAALDGLMKSLALEWGHDDIRINLVLPGFMETAMTEVLTHDICQKSLIQHALGQFNTPYQVAQFIYFLHHHLPFTSGQSFSLDSRILNRA
ncbi:MAG: SDR family oxidoreductase [Akkermansia sp.]